MVKPVTQPEPLILDADSVARWDFRGLLERMAQTVYLEATIRETVQCCELTELLLLFSHLIHKRQSAPPPSATSLLVAKAVAYLQANYTDPHLTVARLGRACRVEFTAVLHSGETVEVITDV